jgi:hypothetical protein
MSCGPRTFWITVAVCAALCPQLTAAQPVAAPEAMEADDDAMPWRGSSFAFTQLITASSLSKNAELSYDPYYAVRFELELQWHFSKATRASVWQALDLELTDSNTTTSRQLSQLLDTMLRLDTELWSHGPADSHDATIVAGATLVTPTSTASQAATLLIGTGAHLAGTLSFAHVLHGAVLGLDGSYLRRFTESTTVRADLPYPCFLGGDSAAQCTQLGGPTNLRDIFTLTLSGHLDFSQRLSLAAATALWWRQGYELAPACATISTGTVCLPDQSTTHWRNLLIVRAGLGYHAFDWLSVTLLAASFSPERSPDGRYRAPLHAIDTYFGLSAELLFDKLYLRARGRPDAAHPKSQP